jgi:uncharacterized membrane protein
LSKPIRSAYCLVFMLFLAGCGGEDEKPPLTGAATGATCGSSTFTYDNFGRNFFTTYCRRCHSEDATDRHGAPGGVNFDTVEQIRESSARIDELAALGPDAANDAMPPSGITPTDTQRDDLGRWLACGAP